jgi:hypothetical protein
VGTAIVYVDDDWAGMTLPGAGVQKPGAPDGTYLQFGRNAFCDGAGRRRRESTRRGRFMSRRVRTPSAFTIAKPVTVLGPNDNISPNAGERVAEAVLQGSTASGLSESVALDATGVVLRGLTFDNLRIDSYTSSAHELITGDVVAFNRFVNVLGTPVYLRDGRNDAPGKYSTGVVVQDNYGSTRPRRLGSDDYNAGSGIIVMGAEALVGQRQRDSFGGLQRHPVRPLQRSSFCRTIRPPAVRSLRCRSPSGTMASFADQRQHLQHALHHQGGGAALRVHQQLQSTVHLYRQYDPG